MPWRQVDDERSSRVRAPSVSLRPPRRLGRQGRCAPGRRGRPLRRHPVRPRTACGGVRAVLLGRGARVPGVDRQPGLPLGGRGVDAAAPRCGRRRRCRGRLCRHEGARRHAAPVATAAPARSRHGAVPRCLLPDLRDGRGPGRVPRRARRGGQWVAPGSRLRRRERRGAGPGALGQQPRQPLRAGRRPGSPGRLGQRTRRAGVQRRVLRGAHLRAGRPQDDPPARLPWRRRGALSVEALEPGRPEGGVLRRGRRRGQVPVGGAQARRVVRCRSGPGRGGRGPGRRRPRIGPEGPLPRTTGLPAGHPGRARGRGSVAGRRALSLGPGARW